ncbi:MAG: PEP-CTERM sorting domain-containing protein [Phycisphaerae bacterium]|nr:PEP-CTERM sorting domain-containing protein [Phycisphaerae bacterium]
MNIRRHSFTVIVLCSALSTAMVPRAAAEGTYEFLYVSTTDEAYNNEAHMLNTGIFVDAGETVSLEGHGTILFSFDGTYSVLTNWDMGLVSPLDEGELMREYGPGPQPHHAEPIPLAGESVLFGQDRAFLNDQHDLNISPVAETSGYVYIGLLDEYFPDNAGAHSFHVVVTPEPATIGMMGLLVLVAVRRRGPLQRQRR